MGKLIINYEYNGEKRRITGSDDVLKITAEHGVRNTVTITAEKPVTLLSAYIVGRFAYEKGQKIFVNGYQSWTDTKDFVVGERLRDVTKLPKSVVGKYSFDGYGDSRFKKYHSGVLHGYDISCTDNLFIGSLNYRNAYLIINHDTVKNRIILESDVGGLKLCGKFTLFDYVTDKGEYFRHFRPKNAPKLLGYTSWYRWYRDINEERILENLAAVDKPFELFQIDDGFERFVGDWLDIDKEKFPHGLGDIVTEIHNKGLKAGIWLAPFVAETKSRVYREHPDWFLKLPSGSNWSGFFGIDINNPEAADYVRQCLLFYKNMGFDFFKLDFLYAVNPVKIDSMTRAQITEKAYSLLSETLSDRVILGCGAIISNSAERFDYLRVGPDVSLKFDDEWYMQYMHRERISTKITLQNTIYRSFLNGRLFANDPDVFLLRDDHIGLSPRQREALITINALFGSVLMTSDNVAEYNPRQRATLGKALSLRNAENVRHERRGRYILIKYRLNGRLTRLVYDTSRGIIMDRSEAVFGNVIPKRTVKNAVRKKANFVKRFGDDSDKDYKIALKPIPSLGFIGVNNIVFGETNEPLPENPLIVGNIRMGFGHYRIAIAMASCARALGYNPLWLDLASFDAAGSRMIRSQNDLYSLASRISQKSALFNKFVWEKMNSEGFKKITYNAADQKNSELLVPIFRNIDKDIPMIATHVWPAQGAVHAGMTHVVNAIPDNWAMGLHLAEGAIHAVQTEFAYMGYKTLNGFADKRLLGMDESEIKVTGHYVDHEIVANLNEDNAKRRARIAGKEPYRILLTIGGAGAGANLFVSMIRHLMPYVKRNEVALFINFGDHLTVYDYLCGKIPALKERCTTYFDEYEKLQSLAESMDKSCVSGIYGIYNSNIFEAVYSTNLLMRKCDLMATKPSELSFYPIPKLMIRHIGGHEVYGAVHAAELGDGTRECSEIGDILMMLDELITDKQITLHMIDTIDRRSAEGFYNGAYECVRLAAGKSCPRRRTD